MNTAKLADANLRMAKEAGVPDGRCFIGLTGGAGPNPKDDRSLTHIQDSCRETRQRPGLNPPGSNPIQPSTRDPEPHYL